MNIDILNTNGKSTGRSIELPDSIFGVEPNQHVLYLAVKDHEKLEKGKVKGKLCVKLKSKHLTTKKKKKSTKLVIKVMEINH